MARSKGKKARREAAASAAATAAAEAGPRMQLLDLHDGVLQHIVRRLGADRRTIMLACKRLRDLAQGLVHSHMQPGMSVQDAIEAADAGDTVHLLPGFYKEALLLKKPLHLVCDGGQARILSPARFAIMCNARGCLLENLCLKSHQIDESVFFLVEYGPRCTHIRMRRCEALQGSFIGIQDLKGPNTYLGLEHCLLHVGVTLMAGRLEMTDCTVKCTGDSLWSYPGTTLVLRRCSFCDVGDPVTVESETAVIEHCQLWAYERGPLLVTAAAAQPDQQEAAVNQRIVYLEEQPPDNVWIHMPRGPAGPEGIKATGKRATEEQRAAVERGQTVPGRVVLWGNTSFESRSNEGITAQQEEVRREARALMTGMQRNLDAAEGLDPADFSIGNSVEDPEPAPGEEGAWDDGADLGWDSDGSLSSDWSGSGSDMDYEDEPGAVIDLVSSSSEETSSSDDSSDDGRAGGGAGGGGGAGAGAGGGDGAAPASGSSSEDESSSSGGSEYSGA